MEPIVTLKAKEPLTKTDRKSADLLIRPQDKPALQMWVDTKCVHPTKSYKGSDTIWGITAETRQTDAEVDYNRLFDFSPDSNPLFIFVIETGGKWSSKATTLFRQILHNGQDRNAVYPAPESLRLRYAMERISVSHQIGNAMCLRRFLAVCIPPSASKQHHNDNVPIPSSSTTTSVSEDRERVNRGT